MFDKIAKSIQGGQWACWRALLKLGTEYLRLPSDLIVFQNPLHPTQYIIFVYHISWVFLWDHGPHLKMIHHLLARGCKSSNLDSISTKGNWFSINGHHPSTCHMWVPAETFFPPYLSHSVSAQLSHPLFSSHTLSSAHSQLFSTLTRYS